MTVNRMANGLVLCDKTNSSLPTLRLDHRGRRHDRPCRDLRDLCRLHRSPGGVRGQRPLKAGLPAVFLSSQELCFGAARCLSHTIFITGSGYTAVLRRVSPVIGSVL